MIVNNVPKWTKESPTQDGYYYWRRGLNFKPVLFLVHAGVATWPGGHSSACSKMEGDWLTIPLPGPENENEG